MKIPAIRTVIFKSMLFLGIVVLTACMWVPAARDDLSVLGNDEFSNLIREAYSENVPRHESIRGHAGVTNGFSRIDREKAQEIARRTMQGKSRKDVIETFKREGGFCTNSPKEKTLVCEVVRKWKLMNIGAPIDTSNWSDPAAKLVYRFVLSETDVVDDLELNIIDTTEHKPIY